MPASEPAADLAQAQAEPAASASLRPAEPAGVFGECTALAAILLVAAGLRIAYLGRPSLGYDEVVTMTLARQPSPSALLHLLPQIDATRAPLHPLLLQAWLRLFGTADVAGRALSVVCGVATVALVYHLGTHLYDKRTALWAAWLAATSPALVQYSQETRMYAWLVLLACAAWAVLFSFRTSASLAKQAVFLGLLVALVYSHPLGLFLVLALSVGFLFNRAEYRLTLRRWTALHVLWAICFAAWLPRYLDHPPEIVFARSWRLLAGWLIPFTGGNGKTLLLLFWPLCAIGLIGLAPRLRLRLDRRLAATSLLAWLLVPPLLLWLYSLVSHSIFGAPRYLLYVAPAYLLLIGHGLAKLPSGVRFGAAGVAVVLAGYMIGDNALSPAVKIDWRSAAAIIEEHAPGVRIVVFSRERQSASVPEHPDVVCLLYYLPANATVTSAGDALAVPAGESMNLGPRAWLVYADPQAGEPAAPAGAISSQYEPVHTWQLLRARLTLCRKRSGAF